VLPRATWAGVMHAPRDWNPRDQSTVLLGLSATLALPPNRPRALRPPLATWSDCATKAVHAPGIDEKSCDLAVSIDPVDYGTRSAGDIDGSEHALVQKKTTPYALGICEIADDLAAIVDPGGFGTRGTRDIDIDGSEHALVQEKATEYALGIAERAHDLAPIIDPKSQGTHGARDLDLGEGQGIRGVVRLVSAAECCRDEDHRWDDQEGERVRIEHKCLALH
jgi:hypothetical protein